MLFKMHYLHFRIRYFAAKMHVLHFKKGLLQMLPKVKYVKVRRLHAFHETFRQAFSSPLPPNGAAYFRMFNNKGPPHDTAPTAFHKAARNFGHAAGPMRRLERTHHPPDADAP